MDKLCIIADTPYQLLNALNYYVQVEHRAITADLYVDLKYETSKKIVKHIQEMNLFDGIIYFENDIQEENKNVSFYINRFAEIMKPNLRIEHCLKTAFKAYENNYSKIICFSGIEFTVAMIRMNATAEVILLDEGNASVVSKNPLTDQYRRTIGGKEFIYRIAGMKLENIVVSSLYLYNPSLYQFKEREFDIKELPSLNCDDKTTMELISIIFGGYDDEEYTGKRIIYLAQPLDIVASNYTNIEKMIAKILKLHAESAIVRLHPALKDVDFYDINTDNKQLMWELLCNNYVNEGSILVAYSSSAQLSPKTMYDKEPYLIFTYRLYKQTKEERNFCEQSVINIKEIYRNPTKVYIPTSLDELNDILNNLDRRKIENE